MQWSAAPAGPGQSIPAQAERARRAAGSKPWPGHILRFDSVRTRVQARGWQGDEVSSAFSFQRFHICKEIVNVRLGERAQKLAMRGKRIIDLHLHLVERK